MQRLTFDNQLTTIYEHPLEDNSNDNSLDIARGL